MKEINEMNIEELRAELVSVKKELADSRESLKKAEDEAKNSLAAFSYTNEENAGLKKKIESLKTIVSLL